MYPTELPSASVSRRGPRRLGSDPQRTLVWVRGEHDIATCALLSDILADAVRLDGADVVVDLSGVTFMDASTVSTLVVARRDLRALTRSLCVRAPSPPARRVLAVCGLEQLIDQRPGVEEQAVAPALGSWVGVPVQDREALLSPVPVDDASRPDAPARTMRWPRLEPALSVRQPEGPL